MNTVAIAISGGVDSGAAAALVLKAGFKAAGFHLSLWSEGIKDKRLENKCCRTDSLEAARKTARQLGIPFYVLNLEKTFKKRVVDYFLKEYSLGRTPNPCVKCNQFIKFGELLDYVRKAGYEFLATGHYAKVIKAIGGKSRFSLLRGKDRKKDQSYFLYNLNQKQLSQVLFPVGEYRKEQVVAMAKKWKLSVASRPESQEICFFPESDYRLFLKRQIGRKIIPGEVVSSKGKKIGNHRGLPLYTVGQRHGFTITDKRVFGPLYIIGKDFKKNQIIVGFGKEAEIRQFWVKNINWINKSGRRAAKSEKGLRCQVRIRHQGEPLVARVKEDEKTGRTNVFLDEGERGISPGQAAVFYRREELIGGGIVVVDKNE